MTDEDRKVLESPARRHTTAQVVAMRARIILESAGGASNKDVAARLEIWPQTVTKWRNRFIDAGVAGLADEDRPDRPRTISDAQVEDIVVRTLEEHPPDGGTHWSTRQMAKRTGMTQTAVSRIWRAFELKPHLAGSWKLATDPFFIDKVKDIAGLYLNPPVRHEAPTDRVG